MKIALYIEDGLEQIVLTPETATERGIIGKLTNGSRTFDIFHGQFYACQGGWVRQREPSYHAQFKPQAEDSTIIVLRPVPTPTPGGAG